jgi:ankyrin repeat protein
MDTGRSGNPERLETMKVRDGGFTSLLFAAQQGAIDAARVLLDAGANVNDTAASGISALVVASHSGHGRFGVFLLDRGADPNADAGGYTALHAAILRGDLVLVQALLAHGADPNRRLRKGTGVRRYPYEWVIPATFIGASPFWLASRYAEPDIMRALAASGADTRAALDDGTTPLMAAAGVGWSPLLSDRRSRTLSADVMAAEAANERRALEAVTVAIEAGGDVNAVNAARETALHGAAAKGFASVVQLLAQKGGNLSAPNRAGRTPMELLERFRASAER